MTAAARILVVFDVALLVVGVAVAAVVTLAADHPVPAERGLTPAQADELVRAHNAWRRKVGVVPLRWATDLAARAQARAEELAADGCVLEHGRLPKDVGENLFGAGPLHSDRRPNVVFAVSPTSVVDMWGDESVDYSPARDACAPNRQCGHYTQVVWAATREVGCGMSVCPSSGQVWVCNYRPRGNVRIVR